MNGKIRNLCKSIKGYLYGFITAENGEVYYFDKRSLGDQSNIEDLSIDDPISFDKREKSVSNHDKVINMKLVDETASEDKIFENEEEIESKLISGISATAYPEIPSESIKFYNHGFANGIDKEKAYGVHLKRGSGEREIIEKLSSVLYISRIDHQTFRQVHFPICIMGATDLLKQYIRGKYEFLLVFSHFDNGDWQQVTLKAEREIRKRKEISERGLLVNFYVLISNARNFKNEIDKIKGANSSTVIPFSFDEIAACKTKIEIISLIIARFGEYLYENNMLGETSVIDDDNLLFGDRGKIADSIVERCKQKKNSGIFGLRRSGKSSVLNAVIRRLQRDGLKYVIVESRTIETADNWRTALYEISKSIRRATLQIEQIDGESRADFENRLKLNSRLEDYNRQAVQTFIEDIALYCRNEIGFVIAIDEIELITFNTAKFAAWQSVESYCGLWSALRDCGCSLIVCGVNSTINEANIIEKDGYEGDNPMHGRIINSNDSVRTYLP